MTALFLLGAQRLFGTEEYLEKDPMPVGFDTGAKYNSVFDAHCITSVYSIRASTYHAKMKCN